MENTNRSLAINTIVLYIRLVLVTVCGLFTTRFALRALGVVDYGLYVVLGGIVALISVINSIMLVTSNRFIGVALGRGSVEEANEQFNVNLFIHILVAILTIIVLLPLGYLYIVNYVHYDGDISVAILVYVISIIGAALSFIGVPFNGLLMAKENFLVFSIVDVISHVIKLLVSILLLYYFTHKLLIYALGMAICAAYPTVVYAVYCNRKLRPYVQYTGIPAWNRMRGVLSFSLWSGYGAVASVAKNQGASLLVNAFFNTVLNAALGIASSVNNYIILFSQNVTKPVSPQLTKNYAAGNYERCESLLIFITKTAYLFMIGISFPILLETEYILSLWLGEVPEGAVIFTRLLIIEALIDSLNNGISEIVFAHGHIAFYQVSTNTAKLLALLLAFVLLKMGYPPTSLLYSYIGVAACVFFLKQYSLSRVPGINQSKLVKQSYLPSVLVTLLLLPLCLIPISISPIVHICISIIYEIIVICFIGLKKTERELLVTTFLDKKNNANTR